MTVSSSGRIAGQQNDPGELLEVFDAAGRPTGRAKTRAAVHVDGDWHQAFHCWIVRADGGVVLQRRALTKDTFPGQWDASAAGHWRFRERPEQAAREIDEELGLHVPFEGLRYCGHERLARRFADRGLIDREHHQVYLLRSDVPLTDFRPNPDEVIGLAAFAAADLLGLLAGRLRRAAAVEALELAADGAFRPAHLTAASDDLVPYSVARLRRLLGCALGNDKIGPPWLKATRTKQRPSARA